MTKMLSSGQIICMSLCICAFTVLSGTDGYSEGMLRGTIFSALIRLIPIIIILATQKYSLKMGKAADVLFMIFFLIFGAQLMISLLGTAKSVSLLPDSRIAGVGLLLAAAIYCASLGLRANARASVPVVILLVIACAVLLAGSLRQLDAANIPVSRENNVYSSAVRDFWSNGELVLLLYLSRYCQRPVGGVLGSYTAATALRVGICLLGVLVLGRLAELTDYPFFLMGAYSQPFSVQRADWIYLVLYVFVAVMSISIQIMLASHILRGFFPKLRCTSLICAAVVLLTAGLIYNAGANLFPLCGALIILLTAAMPCVYYLKELIHHKKEA